MDVIRQKSMSYMNSVKPSTIVQQSNPLPVKNSSSSSINTVATFITALPGIAALILVLMRTSSTAATLSNGGFTTGLNGSLFSSANIGIGTNNPAGKLQVVGNAYVTTGNLGVGTISTPSKLTVLETGAVNSYVTTIRGTNNLNNGLLIDLLNDTGNVDLLRMRSNTSSKFAVYSDGLVEIGNTIEDGELTVYGGLVVDANTSSNSSFLIDAHGSSNAGMFLTGSGKMVLGTVSQAVLSATLSAPYKLQVFGDINIVGNVYNNGELTGGGGSGGGSDLVVVSEYLPNLTVGGTLTVENEIRSNNFLTVVKDTMIGGNLTVMNQTALNGNLTVLGRGNFNDIFVTNDVFFNGNIYQDGELFGATNTGTVTGVTKYSDVNTIVLAASDIDWVSNGPIYQEGRTITTSSLGSYLEKTFTITREGTYILNVNYLLGPDFGFATLLIDGLALTVNSEPQVSDIDLYSPWGSTTPNMLISYTVSLSTGIHTIRIINQGTTVLKNPLSGGYRVGLGDSSLVYIPVAKSPTQVETRISINSLKPDDSTGGWASVNTNLTTVTNGLILTSGKQFDGFYRDINITVEGSYLMNFVLPLDPSYGSVLIEIIGPSGPDSVNTPLDIVDLYTSIGGAGSSRIIKSYSKTLATGSYRLRLTNPGTKNGASVGYTVGAGEINMILINAGLSSFGTVIFSTLKGDVIENDADGWIGANSTSQERGATSRFIPSTGFLNFENIIDGQYNPYSNNTTDFLNMKIMNNDTDDVYIAYVDKISGFLYVKKLSNTLSGGKYEWITLSDRRPNPGYGLATPPIKQDNIVTNDGLENDEETTINYSTQYVSLAVRKVGSIEYIYVAYIQQQDIYSEVDPDNINTRSALDSKVRVKRYINTGVLENSYWTFVSFSPQSSPAISTGPAAHLSLQIDSTGAPIIAYSNVESYDNTRSNANKMVVQRWDSQLNSWYYIVNDNYGMGITNDATLSSTSIDMDSYLVGQQLVITVASGLSGIYPLGREVRIYVTSNRSIYFNGLVASYSGTNLTVNLIGKVGSGIYNTWTIDTVSNNLTAQARNGVTPGGAYFISMALSENTMPNYVPSSTATSSTSLNLTALTVGSSQSITVLSALVNWAGKTLYPVGARVQVYQTDNPSRYFVMDISSYIGSTLTGVVIAKSGTGVINNWTVKYGTMAVSTTGTIMDAFAVGASITFGIGVANLAFPAEEGTVGLPMYPNGCRVRVYRTSEPAKYFILSITDYSGTSLTGTILAKVGSGTHTDWSIEYTTTTSLRNTIYAAFSDGNSRTTVESVNVENGLSVYTFGMSDALHYHQWRYVGPLASEGAVDFVNLMVFPGIRKVRYTATASNSINLGALTISSIISLTVQTGLSYVAGQILAVAYDFDKYFLMEITSYSDTGTTLTGVVRKIVGSGTFSSWSISLGQNLTDEIFVGFEDLFINSSSVVKFVPGTTTPEVADSWKFWGVQGFANGPIHNLVMDGRWVPSRNAPELYAAYRDGRANPLGDTYKNRMSIMYNDGEILPGSTITNTIPTFWNYIQPGAIALNAYETTSTTVLDLNTYQTTSSSVLSLNSQTVGSPLTTTFIIQSGLATFTGERLAIIRSALVPSDYIQLLITGYDTQTGEITGTVQSVEGTATYDKWNICLYKGKLTRRSTDPFDIAKEVVGTHLKTDLTISPSQLIVSGDIARISSTADPTRYLDILVDEYNAVINTTTVLTSLNLAAQTLGAALSPSVTLSDNIPITVGDIIRLSYLNDSIDIEATSYDYTTKVLSGTVIAVTGTGNYSNVVWNVEVIFDAETTTGLTSLNLGTLTIGSPLTVTLVGEVAINSGDRIRLTYNNEYVELETSSYNNITKTLIGEVRTKSGSGSYTNVIWTVKVKRASINGLIRENTWTGVYDNWGVNIHKYSEAVSTVSTGLNLSAQTIGSALSPTITLAVDPTSSIVPGDIVVLSYLTNYVEILVSSYNSITKVLAGTVRTVYGSGVFTVVWTAKVYKGEIALSSTTSLNLSSQVVGNALSPATFVVSSTPEIISVNDIARIYVSTISNLFVDILITSYNTITNVLQGTVRYTSWQSQFSQWTIDVYHTYEVSSTAPKEKVYLRLTDDKPYTQGDSVSIKSASYNISSNPVSLNATVISYTVNTTPTSYYLLECIAETKSINSFFVANNTETSWNISLNAKSSVDSRHFTSGPVSEIGMAVRNFETNNKDIMAIYRLGQPIIYHGSYITIFEEIEEDPGSYPQPADDTLNGFGLEYEYFFPYTTTYRITVEYVMGEEFGVSRMRINGVIVGDPVDCYLADKTPKIWTRPVSYTVSLFAGSNVIRLENSGARNGSSLGYNIGVASVRIEYFSVTRDGDMDSLTVTGTARLNSAAITSLSVANFSGIETLTVGSEVNSLIRLGNAIQPSTSLALPLATVAISDTAQDLTFTNFKTAGGIDFKLTTLLNSGLSTGTAMKLNRYGRLGVGVDIDNVSVAFGVSANLISGNLALLENTNPEGNGLFIKMASNSFGNRFPLRVQAGTDNTLLLTQPGYLGLGVPDSQMFKQFTISGSASFHGGVLDLGNTAANASVINMSDEKASLTYDGAGKLTMRTVDNNSTITLRAGNCSMEMNDSTKTITVNSLDGSISPQINARNTAKAWLYIPGPSGVITIVESHYFNIQAISRIRAGVYSVRMKTPMSSNRYTAIASTDASNGNLNAMVNISSSYIFVIVVRDSFGIERDPGAVSCVVYASSYSS